MFNSDRPIQSSEEDLLDRRHFANALARAVVSYTQKDSLTLGLYGKWGCGKTSIINMFKNELFSQKYNSYGELPIIIEFNPWNFSDQDQLVEQFFLTLYNGLGVSDDRETRGKRAKDIDKLVLGADAISIIPGFSTVAEKISKLLHDYSDALKNADKDTDLKKIKDQISDELVKLDTKIVIIIDDIDRLNNVEIRQIFQLVKSLADFPNTVYLLPFDKDVVINALKDIQKGNGNEYLEKIIQVPIEIPSIDMVKLYNILFYKLDESISDYSKERRDLEYWAKIVAKCVMPFLSTLRDVNRLVNVFAFKYDLVRDEVNIVDLIAVSSLQAFAPGLYNWILNNKSDIIGGTNPNKGSVIIEQQKELEQLERNIKYATKVDPKLAIEILSAIFPAIDQKINYPYQQVDDESLLKKQRIASNEKFDVYFSLSIEDVELSKSEIEYIIYNYDYGQLMSRLQRYSEQDKVISFLIELQSEISDISIDRIPVLLQTMVDISNLLKGVKTKIFFQVTALAYGNLIIIDLLKRYSNESDRFRAIRTAVKNASDDGVPTCAYLLNKLELAHGRFSVNGKKQGEQLIDEKHLKEIERLVLDRIIELIERRNLLDMNGFKVTVYVWSCFDKKSCDEYISALLTENLNVVKFIAHNANEWTSSDRKNNIGWNFKNKDIEKYISVDDAIIKSSEAIQTVEFTKLNIEIKRRAIAFILWNKGLKDTGDEITLNEVDEELQNWKVG